jgi:hypothetical protein
VAAITNILPQARYDCSSKFCHVRSWTIRLSPVVYCLNAGGLNQEAGRGVARSILVSPRPWCNRKIGSARLEIRPAKRSRQPTHVQLANSAHARTVKGFWAELVACHRYRHF